MSFRQLLDADEVAAHADHKCYGDVDEVNWSPGQENVETHQIVAPNALRSPRAMMVIVSDAHIAIVAVPRVARHVHLAVFAFFALILRQIIGWSSYYSGVAEGD